MNLLKRLTRSPHIRGDVADRFRTYLPTGTILDLPAGDGVNSKTLVKSGYSVRAADLFPDACRANGISCERVDMTQPLPYEGESFDGALHSEGIEHIDGQLALLSEFARVLQPGGILMVTTPNVLCLEGRLGLLLTGHPFRRRSIVAASSAYWGRRGQSSPEGDGVYFGHAFLINSFQLRFYLTHVGLEVLEIDTTRFSARSMLLSPFLWLPVWIATRRILRGRRSAIPLELRRALEKEVLGAPLLFGRKLIMVARKPVP